MTKKDLVNEVVKRTDDNYAHTERIINTALQVSKETVVSGKSIYIRGFGTLGATLRKRKVARNISTGAQIVVPARRVPVLKVSHLFRKEVETGRIDQTNQF